MMWETSKPSDTDLLRPLALQAILFIAACGGVGFTGTGYAAQGENEIGVLHLQGNVYMLAGAGSNIAVQIGEDGVVVVDTGAEPMGRRVREAIRELTDRPIRLVINTHVHPDHTGGERDPCSRRPTAVQ